MVGELTWSLSKIANIEGEIPQVILLYNTIALIA
jgi:hypothetical protein